MAEFNYSDYFKEPTIDEQGMTECIEHKRAYPASETGCEECIAEENDD